MHELATTAQLLAASKHQEAGIAALVIGAVLLLIGGARLLLRLAIGAVVPLIGLAILVIGILLMTRTI
jgi:hypothetical protein